MALDRPQQLTRFSPAPWLVLLWLGAGCPAPTPGTDGGVDAGGVADGGTSVPGNWVADGEAVVGPEGGFVRSGDGVFSATFPPGAFATLTTVRVSRFEAQAGDSSTQELRVEGMLPVPGTRYRLEPAGLQAEQPFMVVIGFAVDDVPVPVEPADLGVYFDDAAAWTAAREGWVDGLRTGQPPRAGATVDALGEYVVGLHPPYAEPPALDEIRNGYTPISDRSGPLMETAHGGLLDLVGSGFGWDDSLVEVLVDGVPAETSGVTNRRISAALHLGPAPAAAMTRSVRVQVRGQGSNSLLMRVEGAGACAGQIDRIWPTVAAPGMTVNMVGSLCGTAETRRILVGDKPVTTFPNSAGGFSITLPDLAPGPTTLRTLDGLGSDPGPPADLFVLPTGPIGLSPGLESGGVRLVSARGAEQSLHVMLMVQNLEPYVEAWDGNNLVQGQLEVRVVTPLQDTGYQPIPPISWLYPSTPPSCAGLPSGQCSLPIPFPLLEPLAEGASIQISLRMTQRVGAENAPEGLHVRESNAIALDVKRRAPAGSYDWLNMGRDDQIRPFCSPYTQAFAVGDHVCVYVGGDGDEAETDPCRASVHQLSSTRFFEGTVGFGWCALPDHCFPLDSAGTYTIHNETLGLTCSFEVTTSPGSGTGAATFDPAVGIQVAAGGARLDIPPGALPARAGGEPYRVELHAATDPAPSETDPQRRWDVTYGVRFEPDVSRLNAPIAVTMPAQPSPFPSSSPEFGLIEPETGLTHLVEQGVSMLGDALQWVLPAGDYSAEAPNPVLPATLNISIRKIGVLYRVHSPGVIEDPQGRIRVEYVVDSQSPDYVDSFYAAAVLGGAVEGYERLESLGWRLPDETIRILVRQRVSWADFSGQASGATTSGFLGQPVSAIKSTLPTEEEIRYVTIHEMGHVFQREYTTNVALSWLDEAMSEWIAWKVLGTEFRQRGLTEESAGAFVPTLGLVDSWRGYPSNLVYGTSVWLFWVSQNYGDGAVRLLYEAIDGDALNWASAHRTFRQALGISDVLLMTGPFGDAFWSQTIPPMENLHLSALLATYGVPASFALSGAAGLTVPLMVRPALSSLRYGVRVPAAVESAAAGGELILRAWNMDPLQRITVLHQPSIGSELSGASPLTVLDTTSPIQKFPALLGGTYWFIDNNLSRNRPQASVRMELPHISSVSPSPAAAGNTVGISGLDFGDLPGTLNVGGMAVTPLSWTNTYVRFQMPTFANTSSVGVVLRTVELARTNEVFLAVMPGP